MKVIKIVLAGGPGSGKTAITKLIDPINNPHTHVVILPEIASIFFANRSQEVFDLDRSPVLRQDYILKTQALLEDLFYKELSTKFPDDTLVLICDRGRADAQVYLLPDQLETLRYNAYKSNYDLCIFLNGIRENLSDTDTIRVESDEVETIRLTTKTKTIWENECKHFIEINQCPSILEKAKHTVDRINDYIGYPILKAKNYNKP